MNKHYALVPVATLIALIAILNAVPPSGVQGFFDPLLNAVLNTLFVGIVSLVVAYLSARSYVLDGSMSIILVGSGVLCFGSGHMVGGWFSGSLNVGIAIANIGYLLSSVIILIGATFIATGANIEVSRFRKQVVMVAFLGVLLFVTVLAAIGLQGAMPIFFVEGIGPTPTRLVVLLSAFTLYVISSLIFMLRYGKSHVDLAYWYSLALALLAVGVLGVLLARSIGGPIGWLGRTGLWLGGVYFTVGLFRLLKRIR